MKKQSGFTLVEIAIVLVIIGLLLGGVLKGQELITNAKIKRANNDFNGIGAAVYSYFERYNAIPGDDPNADGRWPAAGGNPAAAPGDGNGIVEGAWDAAAGEESRETWDHLRRSNLVGGSVGNQFPLNAFGGRIGIEDKAFSMSGTVICMEDLQGKVAEIVDNQLDDGNPATGLVRADETTTGVVEGDSGVTAYVADDSYIMCKQL